MRLMRLSRILGVRVRPLRAVAQLIWMSRTFEPARALMRTSTSFAVKCGCSAALSPSSAKIFAAWRLISASRPRGRAAEGHGGAGGGGRLTDGKDNSWTEKPPRRMFLFCCRGV